MVQDPLFGTGAAFRPIPSLMRDFVRASMGVVTNERVIEGVRWKWFEAGPRDGEPLVLLHGFGGSKDNWMLVAPLLARRYRVICPDLPGFGESGPAADGDYSISEQANRIVRFIDALAIGPCHLGGNSMGGFIALAVALDAPEVVASLILMNNAGVDGEEVTSAQVAIKEGRNLFDVSSVDDVDRLFATLLYRPPWLPWLLRRAIAARLGKRRGHQQRILDQILEDALQRPLNARLGEIAVPALVVWGRADRLLHPSAAKVQYEAIPNADMVILDYAGHVPMLERPLRTVREIRSFLQGRTGTAA